MNPEIDETIYYLKVRSSQIQDLSNQMKVGADNIEAIIAENNKLYEALCTLQKLLKS